MDTLPRWASASISARCAAMLAPAFDRFWPNAPQAYREKLWSAIDAAMRSSENGRIESEVDQLEQEVTQLVGRFELLQHARDTNNADMESIANLNFPLDVQPRTLKILSTIVDLVARTLRIVQNEDRDMAFSECCDALEWARAVMDHLDEGARIDSDLDGLIDSLWDFCENSPISDIDGIAFKENRWFLSKK